LACVNFGNSAVPDTKTEGRGGGGTENLADHL